MKKAISALMVSICLVSASPVVAFAETAQPLTSPSTLTVTAVQETPITLGYYEVRTMKLGQITSSKTITLKAPTTSAFSSGKKSWQVQNPDGTWTDIVYNSANATIPYFSGCSYDLLITNFDRLVGNTYRVKMTNTTTGVSNYSAPYKLTNLRAPSYSQSINLATYATN